MVKNLPCNAGDVGLIPGQGTMIPHAAKQLSPQAALLSSCITTMTRHRQINVKRFLKKIFFNHPVFLFSFDIVVNLHM